MSSELPKEMYVVVKDPDAICRYELTEFTMEALEKLMGGEFWFVRIKHRLHMCVNKNQRSLELKKNFMWTDIMICGRVIILNKTWDLLYGLRFREMLLIYNAFRVSEDWFPLYRGAGLGYKWNDKTLKKYQKTLSDKKRKKKK